MDRTFSFGPFHLRPGEHLLLRGDTPIRIGARALELLTILVEHADRIVTKDELLAQVWAGFVVDEGNIRTQIALLRKVLGDGKDGARYLLTVPGRGYRFVGPLSIPATASRSSAVARSVAGLPANLTRLIGRETPPSATFSVD